MHFIKIAYREAYTKASTDRFAIEEGWKTCFEPVLGGHWGFGQGIEVRSALRCVSHFKDAVPSPNAPLKRYFSFAVVGNLGVDDFVGNQITSLDHVAFGAVF